MNLKLGLYEEVISNLLNREITSADTTKVLIEKEKIDDEESPGLIAKHLFTAIQHALSSYKSDIHKQVTLANKILDVLVSETGDAGLNGYKIHLGAEMLLSIISKLNSGIPFSNRKEVLRPVSPLAQSSLFTGTIKEPSLASELKKEILTADKFDCR